MSFDVVHPARRATFLGSSVTRASLMAMALCAGALTVMADARPAISQSSDVASDKSSALSQITVQIDGFRNERGDVLLALFRNADEFPTEPERAELRMMARIEDGRARLVLSGLEPGNVALSVLHDEDGDRKVKTGLFGIPREGMGFSRNARGMFGPPKFGDARLALSPGVNLTVSIRIHYY